MAEEPYLPTIANAKGTWNTSLLPDLDRRQSGSVFIASDGIILMPDGEQGVQLPWAMVESFGVSGAPSGMVINMKGTDYPRITCDINDFDRSLWVTYARDALGITIL